MVHSIIMICIKKISTKKLSKEDKNQLTIKLQLKKLDVPDFPSSDVKQPPSLISFEDAIRPLPVDPQGRMYGAKDGPFTSYPITTVRERIEKIKYILLI